ncbi:PEP-CTERM sorting domain-containing protein [Lacipirellula sp.]|uniref:PEP-CTERM sorting domain-containing protein n=1 Tax=Lacipirellula sp. TaxID=2691419 RepID=UPI003D0B11CE
MRLQLGSSRALLLGVMAWACCQINVASAVSYQFLNVTSTGATTSQFTSANGNGVINVSQVFSAGGAGPLNNVNTAIFPSEFTTLFPGTGQVQGHLAQTNSNSTSVISFDLTGYNLSASTVFGIWNILNDVVTPVYDVKLIDAVNAIQPPSTFNLIGNQDNQTQVAGANNLVLNTATGVLSVGALINNSGTHTNAAFWNNIPLGTKQINVYGNLPVNVGGDGVGYYFAEVVPEPSSATIALVAIGMTGLIVRKRST